MEEIKIVGLDIETLSLRYDCIIHEVGVYGQYISPDDFSVGIDFEETHYMSVAEQLALGRSYTKNTLDFQIRTHGNKRFLGYASGTSTVEDLHSSLAHVLSTAEELWCNHPDFDLARLGSLFESCGLEAPWNYKIVRDVSTLRKFLGVDVKHPGQQHTAVADAKFNLAVVAEARRVLRADLKAKSQLRKYLANQWT
jgi:hypothetical protein